MQRTANTTVQKIKSNEINFIQESYEINAAGKWELTETKESKEDDQFKEYTIKTDTLKWFRRLGGKESVRQGKKHGYGCTINTSISPDGQSKKVRYFFY